MIIYHGFRDRAQGHNMAGLTIDDNILYFFGYSIYCGC